MMRFKKPKEATALESAITDVYSDMKGFTSDADEYSVMVEQLVKLHALKECEKPQRISKDTMLVVAGNLLAVVFVLHYEKANVITTRAMQFVLRKGLLLS